MKMKKIKGLSILTLTGLAVLGLSLSSCDKSENKKDVYGLDNNGEVAKLGNCELVFKDNSEIPYVSLEDGVDWMSQVRQTALKDKKYKYEFKKDGGNFVISNDTGAKCSINKDTQTFVYDDYDKFTSFSTDIQKPLSLFPLSEKNKAIKLVSGEYTAGKKIEVSLKNYSKLDIYEKNDKLYLPISVFNSLLFNTGSNLNLAYNGTNLFLIAASTLVDTSIIPVETDLAKKFREGAAKEKISEEYLDYYYQSLCLDFNINYGLKDKFNDFDTFVTSYDYKKDLLNTDPKQIDNYTGIILSWLNDGHTALSNFSNYYPFGDNKVDETKMNPVKKNLDEMDAAFTKAKEKKNIEEDGLYYSGDTVFVTFKEFKAIDEDSLYASKTSKDDDLGEIGAELDKLLDSLTTANTAKLFNKLYEDLTSGKYKDTIKNIVIDLTANEGGSADALIYSLSTLLGNVTIDSVNSLTGGHSKQVYKADMNADGSIDEKDKSLSERGFKIFFLDSQYSFSSANAMPYIAKLNNPNVVTLGAKTAGGPCALREVVTPINSVIAASSLNTLSKLENGKYVNIDDGIKADVSLTEEQMIDRQYIVENINKWSK